jgi:hypothetical protein
MVEIPRQLDPGRLINHAVRRHETIYLLQAQRLYRRARALGWLHRALALLTGLPSRLLVLDELEADPVAPAAHGRLQPVPLQQIIASEGRCTDFDRAFCPLQGHTRDRWMRVAVARLAGVVVPPVDLVAVGSCYAIRDGHHRLSVARMLGEAAANAVITRATGHRAAQTAQPHVRRSSEAVRTLPRV